MSERKLASIRIIDDVKPIEGADLICAYRVGGWWVVDQVNKYNIGDLVIYLEIDSWVPDAIAPFLSKGKVPKEYNGIPGARLKTVRLKGQLSQGLLLPVSLLNELPLPLVDLDYDSFTNLAADDDVTDRLGIIKWEPPETNAQLGGQSRGNFPHFIRKTDEERIQNIVRDIRKAHSRGDVFEVTMKMDGSSMTTYYYDEDVGVCSRNIALKLDQEGNAFVDMAHKSGLLDALKAYGKNIAVQGELMGPGIQGNREKLDEHKLFVYKVWDIDAQEYLPPKQRHDVLAELYGLGFTMPHVPILSLEYVLPSDDIDELIGIADGPSLNHPHREGLVFKRIDGAFSFKIISNKYLLAKK